MPDSRRIAVVTGTTHGIGKVTARELAAAGFAVVMVCRDTAAGAAVRREILAQTPAAEVHVQACDLASLASVRDCAAALRRDHPVFALLINNAGTVNTRHRLSADRHELTFAVNHLGPFLLTALLQEHLRPGSRIINVASSAHYRGKLDLEMIDMISPPYDARAAYAQSKLANVLHTFALARRLAGSGITANCLHPGIVATNLLPRWLRPVKRLITPDMFDAERGARTTLHLALSPQVSTVNGCYFDEHQRVQRASAAANDIDSQELLWTLSRRWTGLDLDGVAP